MYEIMISGYGGGESVSISKCKVSEDWTKIEEVWKDNIESPSYVCVYEDMCFTISEKEKTGMLFCYKKTGNNFTLTDKIAINGGALCHIYYSPKHKLLFGACYNTGHVLAVEVEEYKFKEIRNFFVIPSDSVDGITRAHCCVPDRSEDRVFVCNIALDRVYVYNIVNGELIENKKFPYVQLDRGEGPRHIRLHPKMDIAYVITEYSNKLIVLSYNRTTGRLTEIQKISTLPEGFMEESYCSTLTFSPDGKYLYAANRGADTISLFEINKDGILQKLQDYDCCGNWPRHIDITFDGQYLMITNQKSENVAVISICQESGKMLKQVTSIPFKEPSFVVEIAK